MAAGLKSLLTPELYTLMVDSYVPFSKSEPLNFGRAIAAVFFEGTAGLGLIRQKAWPALKALSVLGLDNVPNMMTFLPPIDDVDFPRHALGLQLVLDQAPRILLKGVDVRWTYSYLNEISIKYAEQLQDLPAHLNPASWGRWSGSVSVDYFAFVRLWFGAPLVHYEKTMEVAEAFTDETRRLVEETTKTRDPYRDQPEKRDALYGFPDMLKKQGPESPCGVSEGAFWIALLMDVHQPPLKLYGRYPYVNGRIGRVDTPDEEEWMNQAEIFKMDTDLRKRIREDVEAGRWTPLSEPDAN